LNIEDSMAEREDPANTNRVPVPGEHDHTTEATTEPSIVGTTGYGVDLPSNLTADPTLTEEEHERYRWEGGGRIPSAKKRSE
jgi:hypothetical protein